MTGQVHGDHAVTLGQQGRKPTPGVHTRPGAVKQRNDRTRPECLNVQHATAEGDEATGAAMRPHGAVAHPVKTRPHRRVSRVSPGAGDTPYGCISRQT